MTGLSYFGKSKVIIPVKSKKIINLLMNNRKRLIKKTTMRLLMMMKKLWSQGFDKKPQKNKLSSLQMTLG